MPLKPGSSKYVVGSNIKELMSSGRKRSQSIAIALSEAGKSDKPKKAKSARYKDGARLSNLKMPHVVMDTN